MLHIIKRCNPSALVLSVAILFTYTAQAQEELVGDPVAARSKISMCIGCHGIEGYKASFPQVYHVPMIAGQNQEYIISALNEYANGARTFPTMQAIAQSLSDQDIADLAAYYSSFK